LLSSSDEAEFNHLFKRLQEDPLSTLRAEVIEDLARILLLRKRAGFFEAAILEARCEELTRAAKLEALIDLESGRAAAKHRLDHRQWQTFQPAGLKENMVGTPNGRYVVRVSEKHDGHLALGGQTFEQAFVRPLP
jgi:hypothetical protein